MPELPEVETARRIVERELVGRAVEAIALGLPKLMRDSPEPTLAPLLGKTLVGAGRRAKVLAFEFDGGLTLLSHLKLAGQIAVHHDDGTRFAAGHPVPNPAGPYPHKASHLIVRFSGARTLFWSDARQFGWLRLVPSAEVEAILAGFRFGPEAVGPDGIGVEELTRRLARRTIPIKTALLDQGVLAGLGNIYVDEALHAARLHPSRPANGLTPDELVALHVAIGWSLERGIAQGGATIVHNKAYPRDGFPQVHARLGEPCPTCATAIVKTRVGARGTYWCPVCQPDSVPTAENPTLG
ncbi:MAG: Formamidopyrimidine-DNA glycosylase [uncultured Thermomicrobiales bacterium]|uniref:Formamidopyrimidine-DNA glycosylase n=1 Tax=uncultured Thermomicrobiales bacterium TaxID=1645740 RepID=A0A6J4U0E0_9BACT|nr:MAG: Formamidopyrimidine-DNA glycosylase [uncultured Thermomicrobiales bacterium]